MKEWEAWFKASGSDDFWMKISAIDQNRLIYFDFIGNSIKPYFTPDTGLADLYHKLYGKVRFNRKDVERAKKHIDIFLDKINHLSSFL